VKLKEVKEMNKKKTMNIPIFIPHFGCPNDCVFCNQRKISGKNQLDQLDEIRTFIIDSIETIGCRKDVEIAFFGGSFTGLDRNVQKAYLELAREMVLKYELKGIRMSTRPDYIDEGVMNFLSAYPVTSIELGVQSMDEEVLKASKRNHRVEDVWHAVHVIKKYPISLGLQMMLGLPGDTPDKSMETAKKLVSMEPDTVRIYPTLVIKETELEALYYRKLYRPMELKEAIELCGDILECFNNHQIQVIRVGLQANDGLNSDHLIAGPYHPAFKELVMDDLVYRRVMETIKKNRLSKTTIYSNHRMYPRCIGHKQLNRKKFEALGHSVKLDTEMDDGLVRIGSIESGCILSFVF